MHLKRDNIDIMINDEADKVIIIKLYQNNLESLKDSSLSSNMFIYFVINVIK